MKNRFIVIMAGGRGERFWPQSRLKRPKHLLPIVGDAPMLTQTIRRLEGLVPVERIFVITNKEQRESVLETCPDLLPERIIGEPVGRDTAAAVGLAALLVAKEGEDSSFALLPADHVIEDAKEQIIWIPGYCLSESVKVSSRTTQILELEWKNQKGNPV